jgi:hypothetical protein
VIGVPFADGELGQVQPVGLARAGRRGFPGQAVAVNAIAPFVAAFGREDGDPQAKRAITQHDFRNVDVAHGKSRLQRPKVCRLASEHVRLRATMATLGGRISITRSDAEGMNGELRKSGNGERQFEHEGSKGSQRVAVMRLWFG